MFVIGVIGVKKDFIAVVVVVVVVYSLELSYDAWLCSYGIDIYIT